MDDKRVATTAARLKMALSLANMKQADLVRMTGLDKGSISCYVRGKYEPTAVAIRKLAVALNVSEMWLWGYDVYRERTTIQKKNDKLAEVIIKMRKEEDFFALVDMLSKLSPEQYSSIKQLLSAFINK